MAVHITRAGVALTVGIIVLTGLIVGGLFWAKHNGEVARRDEAIAVAEQNLEKDSNKEVVLNEGTATDDTDKQSAQQSTSESTGSSSETSTAAELPQTGPANTSSIFIIGLLAFAFASYYRSRRMANDAL